MSFTDLINEFVPAKASNYAYKAADFYPGKRVVLELLDEFDEHNEEFVVFVELAPFV